jgi:hypothetical protein
MGVGLNIGVGVSVGVGVGVMVAVAEITTEPGPGSPVAVGVTGWLEPNVGQGDGAGEEVTVSEGVADGVLVGEEEAVGVDSSLAAAVWVAWTLESDTALTVGRAVQVGDGLGVTLGDAVGNVVAVVDIATRVGVAPQLERITARVRTRAIRGDLDGLALGLRFIDLFFMLTTSWIISPHKSCQISGPPGPHWPSGL